MSLDSLVEGRTGLLVCLRLRRLYSRTVDLLEPRLAFFGNGDRGWSLSVTLSAMLACDSASAVHDDGDSLYRRWPILSISFFPLCTFLKHVPPYNSLRTSVASGDRVGVTTVSAGVTSVPWL